MADGLLVTKLTTEEFDPKSYVRDLTIQCTSAEDLLSARERIQKLSEETNGLLKKNVYKNYTQFIDTAKEISYLEGEMYQLSHMLTDQQEILNSVLDVSIASGKCWSTSEEGPECEEDNRKNLSSLLEKVEGCAPVLEEKGQAVVHCGELIELSLSDYRPLRRAYCVLLSDGFMIAGKSDRRRGPVQYSFETNYELDYLAVVDVKDDSNVRNAFKILVFPDSRLFQAASPSIKGEWLTVIEQAKKKMTSLKRQLSNGRNPFGDEEDDGINPFDEEDDDGIGSYDKENECNTPSWLMELPEDLDVYIAQREFEEAVNLIHKANQHFANFPRIPKIKQMRAKIDCRVKQLIEILKNELKVSPERSLYGGPRAARRAVSVLLSLNKSSMACDLFLKHRSAMLKQSLKQQTMGGSTAPYIDKLCSVFFSGIIEAGQEFNKAFSHNNSCASTFVVWSKSQLQQFIQLFSRHVFTPQVTASVSAECISHARVHCDRLPEIGLDLSFVLNHLLQSYVERLVTEIRDKMLEAVKLRANEDKWRPQNFQNMTNLSKLLDDMREIGVDNLDSYVYDDFWVSLTANSIAFCKMYLNFVDDLLKLYTSTVHLLISDALVVTFQAQISHIAGAYSNSDKQFVAKNAQFMSECVLSLAGKHFMSKLGLMFPRVSELRAELSKFIPGKTSVPKYSSTVFV